MRGVALLSEGGKAEYCVGVEGDAGFEEKDGPVGSTLKMNSISAPATSADARWAGR